MKKIKEELIQEFNNSPLMVGESVYLSKDYIKLNNIYLSSHNSYIIKAIDGDVITIQGENTRNKSISKITIDGIEIRNSIYKIGVNPFDEKFENIRNVAYSLESISYSLELSEERRNEPIYINNKLINEVNWNPYVYVDGNKKYFQRDFVWSLEQNQLLIESIYKGISCGSVIIRKYSWSYLEKITKTKETEFAFKDIIDGKQRMNAIKLFMNDKFADFNGNYYSDLSNYSQNKFTNHQLFSYAEMPENTSDEEVLYQFLKMNFEGVPQSKEHLEYVKSLIK